MTVPQLSSIAPQTELRQKIGALSGQKLTLCYQCQKCTSGCPVTFAMDIPPHKLMHCLNLGLLDEVLKSATIWVCASCQTCATRCPNGIDIAGLMDTLREISRKENKASSQNSLLFNKEFLSSVKKYGRLHELRMITQYTLKKAGVVGFLKQGGIGRKMFMKGKLKILPNHLKSNKPVKDIFAEAESEAKK